MVVINSYSMNLWPSHQSRVTDANKPMVSFAAATDALPQQEQGRVRRSTDKIVEDLSGFANWVLDRFKDTRQLAFLGSMYVITNAHRYLGLIPGLRCWMEGLFVAGARPKPAKLEESSALLRNEHDLQEVTFKGFDNNTMYGWFVPPKEGKKTFIITPGRGRKLARFNTLMEEMAKRGYGVMIYELRSYGHNKGRFSEKASQKDFLKASQYLHHKQGITVKEQIPFGWSLGGAITAQGAQRRGFPAVVLCSTFTHMNAMTEYLKDQFNIPKGWFTDPNLSNPFDSLEHVQKATAPTLILHGKDDPEVPLIYAEQLFEEVALPASKKDKAWFEGEPHYIDPEKVMNEVESFLKKQKVY